MSDPARGEIWDIDLDPVRGREQAGRRPALVVSIDLFNEGPADLIVVIPLTRTDRRVRWHVRFDPPEGGLTSVSYAKCEDIRSVSKARLIRKRGSITPQSQSDVDDRLRILMGL